MTWLTAREIAGLPCFVMSERATRDKLTRLSIPHRPRPGRQGGGGMEYDCSALPEETRTAITARTIQAAGARALEAVDTPPVRSFLPSAPTASVPCTISRVPSQAEKDVADARVRLVNLVLELVPLHGLRRACQLLAARIITGDAGAEAQNIARQANQRARGGEVSARSLERWVGMHRSNGWFGLLPAAPQSESTPQVDDDVAAVLGLFHSMDHRFRKLSGAAKEVTRMLGRDFDEWRKLYHRARRLLDKLGQSAEASVALIKSRHTGAQRDTRLPFKRRDTSMLAFADVFVIDGHTFKAKVRHPDHGAPFAPELTVVLDAATRLIVGWSVNLSENVIAVGDALRHAVGQYGIPAILYGDNGAGETAKAMDCPIDGICARLGIDHRLGLPGKPQGHGIIERSWQTHAINAARRFGSFQGGDVDAGTFRKVATVLAKEQRAIKRSEQTGEVIALTPKAPTWKQFVDGIEVMVHEYNTQHRHRGLPKRTDGKHPTPMEAFDACFDPALQEKPSELELRTLFMPSVIRTAKRGQVQFFNQFYQAPDLMRRDIDGREVSVRYDIHNPNYVLIYTLGGEFVCEAQWDANRIDYFPKPVIQMAREKRVAQAVKRRELQIDTALRELGPAMDTTPLSLPEPSTPFVTVPSFVETPVSAINSPSTEAVAQAAAGRPFFNGPSERYEWLMRNQDQWTEADGTWLRNYTASESYADLRDYYEGRGLGWNDAGNEPGLKSAL